uniref:Putative alternative splicing factor srp55/b52/srp75 rrm superfamily n=1 Tax=Amblyomma cajennense TaxID=34607 RepID=A0A023FEX1_AMBCJ
MTRVYVGHLSYRVRERDLEKFFRGFGKIREVLLKNGFGFVEFHDYRDADDAVYELNGRELDGERVVVELAHGTARRPPPPRSSWPDSGSGTNRYGPPTRTDYRVIIENLSSRISWQDLKDRMRQVGDVTYADAHRHRRNEGLVGDDYATIDFHVDFLCPAACSGSLI